MRMERFIGNRAEVNRLKIYSQNRLPVLIIGDPGIGKTTLVQDLCEDRKIPLRTGVGGDFPPSHLVGRFDLQNASTVWCDGPLTQAVRDGECWYFDEIDRLNEDCHLVLFPLLDQRRCLHINQRGVVPAHPDFWFVASCNPEGFQRIPRAMRDRFRTVHLQRLGPEEETDLLVRQTVVGEADAEKIVEIGEVVRRIGDQFKISTRQLKAVAENLCFGMSLKEALYDGAFNAIVGVDSRMRTTLQQALFSAGLDGVDFSTVETDPTPMADLESFDDSDFLETAEDESELVRSDSTPF